MIRREELQIQIEQFITSLLAQDEAIKQHDPVSGNRSALKYIDAAKTLIRQGEDGINALAHLLNDPRESVRSMAAAFLIPFRTDESEAILRTLSEGSGLIAFESKMALERWEREGLGIDLT